MKTLLVATLLLSLVASIYSQTVPDPPTQGQLQCITDASTAQALNILNDCGNADLSDVRTYVATHVAALLWCVTISP